jgi:hypothetical protein
MSGGQFSQIEFTWSGRVRAESTGHSVKPGRAWICSGRNSGSVSREGRHKNRFQPPGGTGAETSRPACGSPRLRLGFAFILALEIERHGSADEILQGRLIDPVPFVDVDGALEALPSRRR